MGTAETPGKITAIYRVNLDGSIEALESAEVGSAEQVSMFSTYEGIVVVIEPEKPASAADD